MCARPVAGPNAATVVPLEKVFRFFKRELENHLRKEEEVLFPLIPQLEAAFDPAPRLPRFPFGPLANPIGVMEEDHDAERRQMAKDAGVDRQLQRSGGNRTIYRFAF